MVVVYVTADDESNKATQPRRSKPKICCGTLDVSARRSLDSRVRARRTAQQHRYVRERDYMLLILLYERHDGRQLLLIIVVVL